MTISQDIEALVRRLEALLRSGDVAGCTSLYSEDGVIYSFAEPSVARGRPGIEAMHRCWLDVGEINQYIFVHDARMEGDLGYCAAMWRADSPQDDGSHIPAAGTVLCALKRRSDGVLQFHTSSLTIGTVANFYAPSFFWLVEPSL